MYVSDRNRWNISVKKAIILKIPASIKPFQITALAHILHCRTRALLQKKVKTELANPKKDQSLSVSLPA